MSKRQFFEEPYGDLHSDSPNRLDSDVGARGSTLSMGQRQLVALVRVFLKSPGIFILDEATAGVDPFTEVQIQIGLETLMKQRRAVVIARRLLNRKSPALDNRAVVFYYPQSL